MLKNNQRRGLRISFLNVAGECIKEANYPVQRSFLIIKFLATKKTKIRLEDTKDIHIICTSSNPSQIHAALEKFLE